MAMLKRLRSFLNLGVVTTTSIPSTIAVVPPGIIPDTAANFGFSALLGNIDVIDNDMIAIAYGAATTLTLTPLQWFNNFIDLSGSGVLALTTPTAVQMIAITGPAIPLTGISLMQWITNDGTGQTTTLSGGTGVTILGNNTIATNTTRIFLVSLNASAVTATYLNLGTISL